MPTAAMRSAAPPHPHAPVTRHRARGPCHSTPSDSDATLGTPIGPDGRLTAAPRDATARSTLLRPAKAGVPPGPRRLVLPDASEYDAEVTARSDGVGGLVLKVGGVKTQAVAARLAGATLAVSGESPAPELHAVLSAERRAAAAARKAARAARVAARPPPTCAVFWDGGGPPLPEDPAPLLAALDALARTHGAVPGAVTAAAAPILAAAAAAAGLAVRCPLCRTMCAPVGAVAGAPDLGVHARRVHLRARPYIHQGRAARTPTPLPPRSAALLGALGAKYSGIFAASLAAHSAGLAAVVVLSDDAALLPFLQQLAGRGTVVVLVRSCAAAAVPIPKGAALLTHTWSSLLTTTPAPPLPAPPVTPLSHAEALAILLDGALGPSEALYGDADDFSPDGQLDHPSPSNQPPLSWAARLAVAAATAADDAALAAIAKAMPPPRKRWSRAAAPRKPGQAPTVEAVQVDLDRDRRYDSALKASGDHAAAYQSAYGAKP